MTPPHFDDPPSSPPFTVHTSSSDPSLLPVSRASAVPAQPLHPLSPWNLALSPYRPESLGRKETGDQSLGFGVSLSRGSSMEIYEEREESPYQPKVQSEDTVDMRMEQAGFSPFPQMRPAVYSPPAYIPPAYTSPVSSPSPNAGPVFSPSPTPPAAPLPLPQAPVDREPAYAAPVEPDTKARFLIRPDKIPIMDVTHAYGRAYIVLLKPGEQLQALNSSPFELLLYILRAGKAGLRVKIHINKARAKTGQYCIVPAQNQYRVRNKEGRATARVQVLLS